MLDHDDEVVEAAQPVGGRLELVGVGHQLEEQPTLLEGPEHVVGGERTVGRPHRSDAPEA